MAGCCPEDPRYRDISTDGKYVVQSSERNCSAVSDIAYVVDISYRKTPAGGETTKRILSTDYVITQIEAKPDNVFVVRGKFGTAVPDPVNWKEAKVTFENEVYPLK